MHLYARHMLASTHARLELRMRECPCIIWKMLEVCFNIIDKLESTVGVKFGVPFPFWSSFFVDFSLRIKDLMENKFSSVWLYFVGN